MTQKRNFRWSIPELLPRSFGISQGSGFCLGAHERVATLLGGGVEFTPGHFRVCGFWMCALYIWGLELSSYCQEGP